VLAAVALGAAGAEALDDDPPPADIHMSVDDRDMRPGQRFEVRLELPRNLTYDPGYRLMRREGDRWVAKYDLVAPAVADEPSAGPPDGPSPNPLSGALSGDATHLLELPSDLEPGRYRLKKWFLIMDDQANEFANRGYQVSEAGAIEVAWWTDFDVVRR
jgi:hypothetical protein